jgi:hypothetical protein
MAAAGKQSAVMAFDVGQRAEAIELQLEQPIRMIEGLGNA